MEPTFVLLAGDARLRALSELLQTRGVRAVHLSVCRCVSVLQSQIAASTALVLPVPLSRDGVHLSCSGEECILLSDVFDALQGGQTVFGGGFSPAQTVQIEAQGAKAADFLKDETFVLKNAALTAQGALRLLLEHTTRALGTLRVLVSGFGRVGSATAMLLRAAGCNVTVAARRELQRTKASLSGLRAVPLSALPEILPQTDIVINTVPAPLFPAEVLRHAKKDALYLELASAPFGAKEAEVRAWGMHYVPGGGLPGRFCPDSCAEAMLDTIQAAAEITR